MNESRKEILRTEGISYAYEEGREALKNVSVSIYEGERIAVMGANGAGKSTFFLNLNGVRTPHAGHIFLYGKPIGKKDRNKLREKVGIVFQDADSQIIASTVKGEVAFGPLNMGLSKDEVNEAALTAMETMNLLDHASRPPHYLSGGEKKRVTIADILAMNCAVIIFDEPLASLDPVNADMLEHTLLKLEDEGKTVVLSTHDVDFAYRFASRLLVFADGELIGDGAPDELFQDETLTRKANLKKPAMLRLREILAKRGVLDPEADCPKTLSELDELLKIRYK